jgi:hypothetical protein
LKGLHLSFLLCLIEVSKNLRWLLKPKAYRAFGIDELKYDAIKYLE